MRLLKFTSLIFIVLFSFSSSAQLTTQKKFATGLLSFPVDCNTIDLKANGILLYSSTDKKIIRLNNNYDTVWVKSIIDFTIRDAIFNSSNEIILVGIRSDYQSPITNSTPINLGFEIIKIDLNGNIIQTKYKFLSTTYLSNNLEYYYRASIVEYKPDNYIVVFKGSLYSSSNFTLHQIKVDNNFNILQNKTSTIPYNTFGYSNFGAGSLFKKSENEIIFYGKSNFYLFFYYNSDKNFYVLDTNLNNTIHKQLKDTFRIIQTIDTLGNSLIIGGGVLSNKLIRNQFDTSEYFNGFVTKINLNAPSNFRNRSILFSSSYSPKTNNNLFNYSLIDNSIYVTKSLNGFYINGGFAHDSLSRNFRTNVVKLDSALQIKWSKRLHTFGTNDTIGFQTQFYGQSSYLYSTIGKLLRKNSQLIFSTSHYPYTLNSMITDDEVGFSLTAIDSSGSNATCNSTDEPLLFKYDSVEIIDKPLLNFVADTITLQNKLQTIINEPLYKISNVCLPLKKAKAKFYWYPQNSNGFDSIVCKDSKLYLYDISYNEPKTWHWIFPPQANVSELDSLYLPNVQSISFNQAGVYPVKLVTTNDAGTDTSTQFITVINFIPQPNLGNDTLLCAGDTLKIIYQNPPNSLHNFTGPNSTTTSDTLLISESGQYEIAAYTACGYLYDTINVNFAAKPKANFGFATTCNNLNVVFTDSSLLNFNPSLTHTYAYKPALAPATAYTNFSSLPNNNFTFTTYDSFDIRLVVKSNLSCVTNDTIVKRIVLKAKPVGGFGYTNTCGSLQASITSGASITTGSIALQEYYVGNTLIGTGANFTYNFASYGSYVVKHVVKSNFGCVSDTLPVTVVVKDKPTLSLAVVRDSVCTNTNYTITANASVNASIITNYTWVKNNVLQPNINNQLTDNQPAGVYTYKVIATAATGCKNDTATKIITVVSKPTATLNASNTCGSKTINITSGENVINDNITNYYINYGNGITSITNPNNTTYTYANYGTYELKYIVKSSVGCASDTVPVTVVVKDKPTLSLAVVRDSVCTNTNYTITANASVAASTITNYTWIKNNVLQPNINNQLTDNQPTGVYTYKVIATAATGCKNDTATKIITVVSKPTATLNASNTCGSKRINITSGENVINDNITNYYINYGNGITSITNPNNATYTYANYGTYDLKYIVKSSVGCVSDTVPKTIVVKDKPTLSITYNPADGGTCNNKNFILTATAAVNATTITNYTWLKDGVVLPTTTNILTQNNVACTYVYKVVATASTGCASDDVIQNVTVENFHTTLFTAASGCVGKPIVLTNTSINNNPLGAITYTWTTSDGQTNNAVLPNFSFATTGPKTIQLKTNTQNNCADSLTKTITIEDFPIADFTITEACLGKKIAIVNNSTGAISVYNWQTSSGQIGNATVPDFRFNNVGNYTIDLTVATPNNCTDTTSRSTNIQAVQLFTTPVVDTNAVVNQPVQLSITGAANYNWQFTGGNIQGGSLQGANGNAPIFTAPAVGIYPIQIEGITAQGCKGNASIKINVFTANNYVWVPNAFTPNSDGLNDRIKITCSGLQSLTKFIIYNRYGEMVYQQTACNTTGWNGTYKDNQQPMGAFVYYWSGVDFKGKAVSGKGTVMLVR
jgi:gliding motility-associated-like protein